MRLAIILAYSGGGQDLLIYHYLAELALNGQNPYQAPPGGAIDPRYADIPALNLGIFAAVLAFKNDPISIRLLFAVVDTAIILTLGLLVRRPPGWRRDVMLFYAFNPLVLIALVAISEDKVILILGILLLFVSLDYGRRLGSILLTTFLAVFKWIGVLFILPLAAFLAQSRREFMLYVGIFVVLFLLSHVPYFPDSLVTYANREARMMMTPTHASATILLWKLGIYHPLIPRIAVLASGLVVYSLFVARSIGIRETIVLMIFFVNIGTPEAGVDRILMISLPFFLIIDMTRTRWLTVWAATSLAFVGVAVNLRVLQAAHPVVGELRDLVFGTFGSTKYAAWANLLPVVMLVYYMRDKWDGKVDWNDRFEGHRWTLLRPSRP